MSDGNSKTLDSEMFREFYEEQLQRAKSDTGPEPADSIEVQQKVRDALNQAREEAGTNAQETYLCRAYSLADISYDQAAEIFLMSRHKVGETLRNDPQVSTPGRPDFGDD